LKCGDTIVDYLTAKEKKNLFKLQVTLEQMRETVQYLYEAGKLDSLHIERLNATINGLQKQIEQGKKANALMGNAYNSELKIARSLKRELKLTKVKAWLGGVFGTAGAFGAGVGVAFLILKTK